MDTAQNYVRLISQMNPNYNICFISSSKEFVFVSTQKPMNGFSQDLVKWRDMDRDQGADPGFFLSLPQHWGLLLKIPTE